MEFHPPPKRSQTTTWKEFIRRHMDVLSGADFFTVEVLSPGVEEFRQTSGPSNRCRERLGSLLKYYYPRVA
jgi:hypothetical protein